MILKKQEHDWTFDPLAWVGEDIKCRKCGKIFDYELLASEQGQCNDIDLFGTIVGVIKTGVSWSTQWMR